MWHDTSWDKNGGNVIKYMSGEFDHLHTEQPHIELFYRRFSLSSKKLSNVATELSLRDDQVGQLEAAIRDVGGELQKAQPKYPVISEGLKILRDFLIQVAGRAAG
jgi:hypothetical protein